MRIESCIPIIPSGDLEKSLRLWVDGFGFVVANEMRDASGQLVFCMLHNGALHFMLNQRAGTAVKPENYEGIRLYWAPSDLQGMRQHLAKLCFPVSEIVEREYGQTEFFLTDEDGFSHCFGVAKSEG